jgi:monoterpene epsilon-lactone hydrolase
MPSFRSRLFIFSLKHRHLLQGQLKRRATVDWNTSMPELRAEIEKGAGFFGKLPDGFTLEPVDIDGLPAEWMLPPGAAKDRAILYFHGGGYATGSIPAHRGIVAKFVSASDTGALLFEYRLAPEHPFPAALEDAVAAYRYMLAQGVAPERIVFIGDSAGGGLVLATLLAARDQGLPPPAGAVALSPWTDVKNTGASWETNAKVDPLTWRESQAVFAKYYAGDQDAGNPLMSPLYGDLHGLPPLMIYVGGYEVMLDDSTRFAAKAQAAGVAVTLHIGKGMFHCYPACAPLFPEAKQAMEEIGAFVKEMAGARVASPA